jgi:hypothetical protein
MEKQTASDWKIARSYWFSSFVVGLLVTMIPMVLVNIVNGSVNAGKANGLTTTIFAVVGLLAIWLGAMYAGKSISKKYFIKNKENVAINALALNLGITLFLVAGGLLIISMVPGIMEGSGSLTYTDLGISSVEACATTLVYLYTALKYIKVNN